MRFLPVRDDAVLIELDDLESTLALFDSLSSDPIPGTGELIPGARTLLVFYRPSAVTPAAIARAARSRDLGSRVAGEGNLVEIPVRYDGEDLAEVAALLGVTAAEVVAMHTGQDYAVGFTGFAPGFAYLTGGHPALNVPRRTSPRTRIPAGSVALAGTFSGVYPRESPGGWQLIGTTESLMWDLGRERAALMLPGDRVRFVDVSGRTGSTADAATGVTASPATGSTTAAMPRPRTRSRSSTRACSRYCRTSAGPGTPAWACPAPARSTRCRCARPTGWSATPPAPPGWNSPSAASACAHMANRCSPSPAHRCR